MTCPSSRQAIGVGIPCRLRRADAAGPGLAGWERQVVDAAELHLIELPPGGAGGRIGAGFVRGLETTLTFDEEQFVGSGLFLFASVLERFLGLYSSINSFNQLVIRTEQREEIVRRFAPRAGEQELS